MARKRAAPGTKSRRRRAGTTFKQRFAAARWSGQALQDREEGMSWRDGPRYLSPEWEHNLGDSQLADMN